MNRLFLFWAITISILLSGCQTVGPVNKPTDQPAPNAVMFIDLDGFDLDLAKSLQAHQDIVTVNFIEKPSPNQTPERLQKWIARLRERGGKVEVETPSNELAPKNPLALLGLLSSLWSGKSAAEEIVKETSFNVVEGRNAVIRLERNANKQLVIGQLVFVKR